MENVRPPTTSYLSSLRTLADDLFASVQERIELFAVELQEEKFRLIQTFFWMSAVAFTGMIAITFASLSVVYLFWDSARLAVLSGLTALYAGTLIVIVCGFRRFLARQPRPFAATLEAVAADRTCIRNAN